MDYEHSQRMAIALEQLREDITSPIAIFNPVLSFSCGIWRFEYGSLWGSGTTPEKAALSFINHYYNGYRNERD